MGGMRFYIVFLMFPGLVLPARAQTKIHLPTQTREADFSQSSITKPARTGSTLPSTCSVGEAFFRTGVTAGLNLYGCTSANTWTILGDGSGGGTGGGASSFSGLTDLAVTVTGNVFSVAAGKARFGSVTTVFNSSSLTVASGSDTGTIRFFVDYNAGSPRVSCLYPATFAGIYTPAGMICSTGVLFPDNSIPLATADVSSGTAQIPVDLRAAHQIGPIPAAGTNLVSSVAQGGRTVTLSVDTSVVPQYSTGSGAPAGICTPGRDFYVDTAAARLYFCSGTNAWTAAN